MSENPNPMPSFIRSGGIIGSPVQLTSQVCTRDAPGNIPLIIYDNAANYASGNGALCDNLLAIPTGPVAKSVLFLFIKLLGATTPVWQLYDEFDLPALAAVSASGKNNPYPLRCASTQQLHAPQPKVGTNAAFDGFRINGSSTSIQYGVALGTAIGSLPLIVCMNGGEY